MAVCAGSYHLSKRMIEELVSDLALGPCGDGPPSVTPLSWSYSMHETPATIPAGGEYLGCDRMTLKAPPTPRSTFLQSLHSNVDKGTHHLVLFFDDAPLSASRTCSNDPTTPLFFPYLTNGIAGAIDFVATSAKRLPEIATGVGPYDWSVPPGYGIFLDASGDGQSVTNHHYLNASPQAIVVGGSYEIHVSDSVSRKGRA